MKKFGLLLLGVCSSIEFYIHMQQTLFSNDFFNQCDKFNLQPLRFKVFIFLLEVCESISILCFIIIWFGEKIASYVNKSEKDSK